MTPDQIIFLAMQVRTAQKELYNEYQYAVDSGNPNMDSTFHDLSLIVTDLEIKLDEALVTYTPKK